MCDALLELFYYTEMTLVHVPMLFMSMKPYRCIPKSLIYGTAVKLVIKKY